MKLPALRLDKEALGEFLLRHGEKIVGAVVAVGVALLIWGGIDAIRFRSIRRPELPDSIRAEVAGADAHIRSMPRPPDALLPKHAALAAAIDPWLEAKPQPAPSFAVLDKPLFPELSRRSQPEVLPAEQLQAIAGIAVFPGQQAGGEAAGRPGALPDGDLRGAQARIVPYVVVTGLIPVAKQREEYRRRFAEAGYTDELRDAPLWCDFELEKCIVTNDQDGPWRPIDLAAVARMQAREWPGAHPIPIPPEYVLQSAEERRSPETPLAFAGMLPQRIDRPWATEPIHPWVLEHMRSRPQPVAKDAGEQPKDEPLPDYRLFAFVDTAVKPDTAYRYRLRLKVGNPNLQVPKEHLVDPALAKESRLASPTSTATAAARVPDPQTLLLDVVSADDVKKLKLKPGVVEVLVLDASAETGNYALRSVLLDVGGFANIDKRLNRPGETRARGEDVITDRLLIDVFGQQIDGDDKPRRGTRKIPEPFTAVFLRPDGSLEQVTAADSERLIDRYRDTLPERDAGRRETRPAAGPAGEFGGFPGGPEPQAPGLQGGQMPPANSPFPPRR